ncbi:MULTISPECIES: DUF2955 domain-containing protein [unclassified Shewanella]|uniref:DUF2955 domain-containing protein n=1 Tax=unclassified Shewanella TaxID=196818 RepID=UPI000C826F15|nr:MULTISPECIES: DUF2955 domain-containing protein [unclassified Shewanella]MDO6679431.1 DUF2955 domain-containing protein [Shewanella sp. 4_MG-2023]PMG51452.1 multidrug DMT transporter permease [Shewanella sp. 10N.286.52.B9]PMH87979.1 multidrug DMT transporter permease [Shewanella sp. 10N.286.48.B5]
MFRNAVNPIIRLVFFPVFLLFYLQYSGAAMPILAPMFVVIFLTIMPSKPPMSMLLKLLIILFFLSFILVFLAGVLKDTPTGYALFCWGLFFWCFYRSHHDPKDMLATLALMVVIIMTVMNFQMGAPVDVLPWLMFEAFLIAIVITYISFLLFPGDEQDILMDETVKEGAQTNIGLIMFKATAMCITLVVLISIGSTQTMLIAITIGSLIKIPISNDHRIYSQNKIVTTATGILFTLPVMLLFAFGVSTWMLIGVTLFCGLQLACFGIRRQCRFSIYQLLFTNFIVLTYQIIKHQAADSLSSEFTRLISIVIAILVGVLILNLSKHSAVPLVKEDK